MTIFWRHPDKETYRFGKSELTRKEVEKIEKLKGIKSQEINWLTKEQQKQFDECTGASKDLE